MCLQPGGPVLHTFQLTLCLLLYPDLQILGTSLVSKYLDMLLCPVQFCFVWDPRQPNSHRWILLMWILSQGSQGKGGKPFVYTKEQKLVLQDFDQCMYPVWSKGRWHEGFLWLSTRTWSTSALSLSAAVKIVTAHSANSSLFRILHPRCFISGQDGWGPLGK